MLTLPIKGCWFDMILCGKKTEEYREIKPYYSSRFKKILADKHPSYQSFISYYSDFTSEYFKVKLVNGYGNDKPYIIAKVRLTVDRGYPDMGAIRGRYYYVLLIDEIVKIGNVSKQRLNTIKNIYKKRSD